MHSVLQGVSGVCPVYLKMFVSESVCEHGACSVVVMVVGS